MKKRLLAMMMAMAMAGTSVPANVFAGEAVEVEAVDGFVGENVEESETSEVLASSEDDTMDVLNEEKAAVKEDAEVEELDAGGEESVDQAVIVDSEDVADTDAINYEDILIDFDEDVMDVTDTEDFAVASMLIDAEQDEDELADGLSIGDWGNSENTEEDLLGADGAAEEIKLDPDAEEGLFDDELDLDEEENAAEMVLSESTYTSSDGHRYECIDESMTWTDAEAYCESLGGHLATITSSAEQAVVTELISGGTKKSYWLGASKVSGSWSWVTGEAFNYTNWVSGEPNNYRGVEYYLEIHRVANPKRSGSAGKWNDISINNYISDETSYFSLEHVGLICEWETGKTTIEISSPVTETIVGEEFALSAGVENELDVSTALPVTWSVEEADGLTLSEAEVNAGDKSALVTTTATPTKEGKYTITATTADGVSDSVEIEVKALYSIDEIPDQVYDPDKPSEPEVTVRETKSGSIVDSSNYTIEYADNERTGIAKATITINVDNSSYNVKFYIVPRQVEKPEDGELSEPHVGWIKLRWKPLDKKEVDGYRVTYYITSEEDDEDNKIVEYISGYASTEIEIGRDNRELDRNEVYSFEIQGYKEIDEQQLLGEELYETVLISDGPLINDCWGLENPGVVLAPRHYLWYTQDFGEIYLHTLEHYGGDGICFGMALTSATSWFNHFPDVDQYGVTSLYDIKRTPVNGTYQNSLIDYAMYAQAYEQFGGRSHLTAWLKTGRNDGDEYSAYAYYNGLNDIYKAVKAYTEGGKPVIIKVKQKNGRTSTNLGHSLLALDYYDSVDNVQIEVYDPNYPGETRYFTLYKEDEDNDCFSSWEYSGSLPSGLNNIGQAYSSVSDVPVSGSWTQIGYVNAITGNNWYTDRSSDEVDTVLFLLTSADSMLIDVIENGFRQELIYWNYGDSTTNAQTGDIISESRMYSLYLENEYHFSLPKGVEAMLADGNKVISISGDNDCDFILSFEENGNCCVKALSTNDATISVTFKNFIAQDDTADNVLIETNAFVTKIQSDVEATINSSDEYTYMKGCDQVKIVSINQIGYDTDSPTFTFSGELETLDLSVNLDYRYCVNKEEEYAEITCDEQGDGSYSTSVLLQDMHTYVELKTTATVGGAAYGDSGKFEINKRVSVSAQADSEYYFAGWYVGNELVSTSLTYSFVIEQDTVLEARFAERINVATNATAALSTTSYTYDGSAKKPSVTVKNSSGATLTLGTDCTVTYSSNTNAGTATVTITGAGNYTGTIRKTFTINKASLVSAVLSTSSYTYDGSAKKPSVTVKNSSGKTLTSGTDYTVSYSSNTNAGTATVAITGKGNYTGTITKNFTIAKASLASVTLKTTSYTYDGSAKKPSVNVKNSSGKTLTINVDYTVAYRSNINVGTAVAAVTGKGNYTGKVEKSFAIVQAKNSAKIPANAKKYNGHSYYVYETSMLNLTGDAVSKYKALEAYCESLGGHLATITSEYEDKAVYYFVKQFGYTTAYFGYSDHEKEGKWKWITGETSSYKNWASGEPNSENAAEDYAMYYYKYPDGKWNDEDLDDDEAFICEWEGVKNTTAISSVSLSKTTYTYNGKAKKPAVTVKASNGAVLKKGIDYIMSYNNNKDVGTAWVEVIGIGNYEGRRIVGYTITPKNTKISSVKAGKKSFTVKWKKKTTQISGYEIAYSTSRKFKTYYVAKVNNAAKVSKTISKLKSRKKYYVKIRTFSNVGYLAYSVYRSDWSAVKQVVTK